MSNALNYLEALPFEVGFLGLILQKTVVSRHFPYQLHRKRLNPMPNVILNQNAFWYRIALLSGLEFFRSQPEYVNFTALPPAKNIRKGLYQIPNLILNLTRLY